MIVQEIKPDTYTVPTNAARKHMYEQCGESLYLSSLYREHVYRAVFRWWVVYTGGYLRVLYIIGLLRIAQNAARVWGEEGVASGKLCYIRVSMYVSPIVFLSQLPSNTPSIATRVHTE